jgi:hypothetical protein
LQDESLPQRLLPELGASWQSIRGRFGGVADCKLLLVLEFVSEHLFGIVRISCQKARSWGVVATNLATYSLPVDLATKQHERILRRRRGGAESDAYIELPKSERRQVESLRPREVAGELYSMGFGIWAETGAVLNFCSL